MSFYRAFYHLVWATKYRSNLITADIEPFLHDVIRAKAIQLESTVFAVNGTENHVHVVCSIPPSVAVGKLVQQVKGLSSFRVNQLENRSVPFIWQSEFGVFTFDEKRLPNYVAYVEAQKINHLHNNLIPILERFDPLPASTLRETSVPYGTEIYTWWNEMISLE